MNKEELRREYRKRIRTIDTGDESRRIVQNIFKLPEYDAARAILAFSPLSDEPDISPILQDRRVLLPYISNGRMAFSASRNLHRSEFGFLEPEKIEEDYRSALMLVPLLGYNSRLYRLGRGGGYYDRYIMENRNRIITIGLAFSISYFPALMEEDHDEALDYILTPSGRMTATSAS